MSQKTLRKHWKPSVKAGASHLLGEGVKQAIKVRSVNRVADLVKYAGKSVKPLAKRLSPTLAKGIGKATNKGTIRAIGKFFRKIVPRGKAASGAVLGAVTNPIVEFASRAIEKRPLFSKAALFKYGSAIVKGAVTGAIVGSVAPGPGTVAGFVAGLVIGIGVALAVDAVTAPAEKKLMDHMGITDD